MKTTNPSRALMILGFLTLCFLMAPGSSPASSPPPSTRVRQGHESGGQGKPPPSRTASIRRPVGDGEIQDYTQRDPLRSISRFVGGCEGIDIFGGGV